MNLKLVMVDDDELVIFLHKMIIDSSGLFLDIKACNSGRAALDYMCEQQADDTFFLVLLDINMPVMNGWDVLDAVQGMPFAGNMRVVMLTSSINTADKEKASKYPQVISFREKPLTVEMCAEIKRLPDIAGL